MHCVGGSITVLWRNCCHGNYHPDCSPWHSVCLAKATWHFLSPLMMMYVLQPLIISRQIPNRADAFCQSAVVLSLDLSLKAVQTARIDMRVLASVVWFQGNVAEIVVQYWRTETLTDAWSTLSHKHKTIPEADEELGPLWGTLSNMFLHFKELKQLASFWLAAGETEFHITGWDELNEKKKKRCC